MNKLFSIIFLALFITCSLAAKSATEKAANAASDLKDKVVETVCCFFDISLTIFFLLNR